MLRNKPKDYSYLLDYKRFMGLLRNIYYYFTDIVYISKRNIINRQNNSYDRIYKNQNCFLEFFKEEIKINI